MNTFTIMVDTNCDLPKDYIEDNDIKVLALPFQIDGKDYLGGYWQEISGKEYYDALRGGGCATTSQINLDAFSQAFTQYAEKGDKLIVILLSSGLSGTYHNAELALADVKASYPECEIYLIDSRSASVGSGMLAMLAVRKRREGNSAKETAKWLTEKRNSVYSLFTVDDLMYLHRGGRLSKMTAIAGSLLSIKPLLNIAPDGTLHLKEKARGRKAALEKLAEQMRRAVKPGAKLQCVNISHTDAIEDAQRLEKMIRENFEVQQVVTMLTGPIIGAHLGPGAIVLVFVGDITRQEYENKYYKGSY